MRMMSEKASFSSRVDVLRDAVNEDDITKKRLGKELEMLLEDFYSHNGTVYGFRINDFFYVTLAYEGHIKKDTESFVIEYLSEMVGNKFLLTFQLFGTRELIICPFSGDIKSEYSENIEQLRGDQCLFNSGILYKYSEASKDFSGPLQFRSLGEKAYRKVAEHEIATKNKKLFSNLSDNYLAHESVLRAVSDKYIFGKNNEFIMRAFTNSVGNSAGNSFAVPSNSDFKTFNRLWDIIK
jgi:hypothetical protein